MRKLRSAAFTGTLATEAESVDGKISKEIEHMFYAKVSSPETLLNALCVEIQEQWGLWSPKTDKNAGSGSNRVRKTITKQIVAGQIANADDQVQYVMTTKLKLPDGSSLEVPVESSEAGLQAFRLLAESGMIKHRYRFPIDGTDMTWEVDMFIEPGESIHSGKYVGWAKIDLEVPSFDTPIPELPRGFTDMFNSKIESPTPEQAEIIRKMQDYLNLPNPHLTQIYPDVLP